jgi:hypothetical protein
VYQHKVEAAAVLPLTAAHQVLVPMAEPRLVPVAADLDATDYLVWELLRVEQVPQLTVMVAAVAGQAQLAQQAQTLLEQAMVEMEHFPQFLELLHTTEQVVAVVPTAL